VIRNLLSNAIKFTPSGGTVTISAKSTENCMTVIYVKDTGIGIPDTIRNNLFRIDANTKRPGTNGEQSTGLGLLLCKEFVEKNGGKIGVESLQEGGSVFNFTIPSKGQSGDIINEKIESTVIQVIKINNPKILIAEDDVISGKLLAAMIKGFSKEILIVKTGIDVVETIRNNPDIDLILLDISMPELDGYEATRQIRQFNTKVVIIAQTALASNRDIEMALSAGCNDHIAKPVKIMALKSLILKYFDKLE
jgi:CheY-like chemotaxis protein